ncbi:MAG: hypothetical protein COZ24_00115 [Hydrogenophilales bacterium CG_4_10_14_3_um_filter_63_21]|nr:MAG: hypothetical protein COZ24_00115 [Hydrogenophilales bacterium CG_4_10_14_3_um_filter_63_21]
MKNPLLSSFVIVTVFWYVMLAIPSRALLHEIPVYALKGLWIALVGVFWGVLAFAVWLAVVRGNKQHGLKSGDSRRGLSISLGDFPRGAPPPARVPCGETFLPETFSTWFTAYQAAHPTHAALMRAVMEVYQARALLPASPVPGGHGGATLMQHSLNVLATILNMAPSWRYDGHKNKKGQVVFPLIDGTYRFDATDPLIPIAGFAHDIGKITCYRQREDGLVEEIKPHHDTEGGKILITLEAFWALPKGDRDALNLALSFYHHINSLPLWADDRTRALTELLITADIRTGMAEGEKNLAALYEDIDALPGWLDGQMDEVMATLPAQPIPVQDTPADHVADVAVARAGSAPADENDGWAWDQFEALILEPGRINGNNKAMRVGFKHGEWVYVNDAVLRTALAAALNASRLTEQAGRGQMSPFTRLLLSRLARMGLLYQHHDGRDFSEKSALFKMVMHGTGGKIVQNWGFTMIFKATAFPVIAAMPDCKYPPQVLGCGFGEHRAINKSGKPEPEAPSQSIEAANSGNGIPLDADGIEGAVHALRNAMASAEPPQFKERTDKGGVWACYALDTLKSRVPLAGGWDVLAGSELPIEASARWVRGASDLFLCLCIGEAPHQG